MNREREAPQQSKVWIKDGVVFSDRGNEGVRTICRGLFEISVARDQKNASWSSLVEFEDLDQHRKSVVLSDGDLLGGSRLWLQKLIDDGLQLVDISNPGIEAFRSFIWSQRTGSERKVRLVHQSGWVAGCYVTADGTTLGETNERIVHVARAPIKHGPKGSLEDWSANVAAYASGNSRLILALSMAFAGPLLRHLGADTIGVHFWGSSSIGKTTTLRLPASVYGFPQEWIDTWRSTDNGLEAIAARRSDGLVILDEIGQADPRRLAEVIYMMGNGSSKLRSNVRGDVRSQRRWIATWVSTGERSISEAIAACGAQLHTGQEVRLLDIAAEVKTGTIFESLHHFESGGALAEHLRRACDEFNGVALPSFVRSLLNSQRDLEQSLRWARTIVGERFHPPELGELRRVVKNFEAVAMAGCLAAEKLKLPICTDEVLWGVETCMKSLLTDRSSLPSHEKRLIGQVQGLLNQFRGSRFLRMDQSGDDKIPQMWGCIDCSGQFWIFVQPFKNELCKGFDSRWAAKVLRERGYLVTDTQGRSTVPKNINRHVQRVYVLKPDVLEFDCS